jgi:hypothetical protein
MRVFKVLLTTSAGSQYSSSTETQTRQRDKHESCCWSYEFGKLEPSKVGTSGVSLSLYDDQVVAGTGAPEVCNSIRVKLHVDSNPVTSALQGANFNM